MTDLSWAHALMGCAFGSGLTLILIGTRKRSKRRNKRIGLPSPACARFPAWDSASAVVTRREVQ